MVSLKNSLCSKIILVVDDQPNNLQLLFNYLKNSGYKILIAQNGKKAIKTALSVHPDLILLDVMMPEIDGFETCHSLKSNTSTKDIPIIFMTALSETEHKVQGLRLGAVDYITKPIEQEELLARIKTHLSLNLQDKELSDFAFLDPLTTVYNRRYFNRQLNLEWRRLQRINCPLSIVICEVDCFKIYNDTYGRQKGDECLQQVAQAIGKTLKRPADIVARYGGEEFTVILPHTNQSGAIKVAEAMRVAVKDLNIPHHNSLVDTVVTISLGVASTIPNSTDDPALLRQAADVALSNAKKLGRDGVAVYLESISQSKDRQKLERHWVQRLRQALQKSLFSLYAQPIAPLEIDDQKRYFEILLRLTDEEDRVIAPNIFLDIAERNFLMPDVDRWVINNLLEILVANGNCSDWKNYCFSINLSGSSLNSKSFLEFLSQKLTDYHLPPDLFCFEITETVAISNLAMTAKFLNSLRNLGCSVALDDFGKGMSSLTYLKNLPVDYLKIDGSFIKELHEDQASKVMVEAINLIAEGIGLKTVAEFVENQIILDSVRDLKIDYAQGFYLGRPGVLMDVISRN